MRNVLMFDSIDSNMSVIGFEAKNQKGRGAVCNRCASAANLPTEKFNEVTSGQYRDCYCVFCHERLGGGGTKTPSSVDEGIAVVLDESFDRAHPVLNLAPGEKPEKTDIAPGVTKSEHPDDANHTIFISLIDEKIYSEIKKTLDTVEQLGYIRYSSRTIEGDETTADTFELSIISSR